MANEANVPDDRLPDDIESGLEKVHAIACGQPNTACGPSSVCELFRILLRRAIRVALDDVRHEKYQRGYQQAILDINAGKQGHECSGIAACKKALTQLGRQGYEGALCDELAAAIRAAEGK